MDSENRVRLVAVGSRRNPDLSRQGMKAEQLAWGEVILFIRNRFKSYGRIKSQHEQWDECGKFLYKVS